MNPPIAFSISSRRHRSVAVRIAAALGIAICIAGWDTSTIVASPVAAPDKPLDPALFNAVNRAEMAFAAKIRTLQLIAVSAPGSPHRFTAIVTFEKATMLRGADPEQATFSYALTEKPTVGVGSEVIAAGYSQARPKGLPGNGRLYQQTAMLPATEAERRRVAEPLALPIGWSREDGKLVSPWAALGGVKWAADVKADAVCSKTGRPALRAGAGIQLTTDKVPAKQVFTPPMGKAAKGVLLNPDGDGDIKLTVTNTGKQEVQVPALLTDGKRIDWAGSVVVLRGGTQAEVPGYEWKPRVARGASASKDLKPVSLKPGESVTGVVNVLRLHGELPIVKTASQLIKFRICLGELSSTEIFVYTNAHHDKIAAAKKGP